MKTVIFASGLYTPNLHTTQAIRQAEYLIAADNGAQYCLSHGILPDVVIGDLDSLHPKILKELSLAETEIIQYPEEKDSTDFELALRHALLRGATEIIVLGALGGRWDMSFSNLFLLTHPDYSDLRLSLLQNDHRLTILHPHQTLLIDGQIGDLVSLLPLTPRVLGIKTTHLHYPLHDEHLDFASSRGVSNRLLATQARITLGAGILVCIHYFQHYRPES